MKNLINLISLLVLFTLNSSGQLLPVKRNIQFKFFDHDSVNISFNRQYLLIEDTCAEIVRLGHYSPVIRKFTGAFKDVSRLNEKVLVARGSYDRNGLKDGDFTTYYLNGSLQAKGNFKNNSFNGKWHFYYPNGKPKLSFEVNDKGVKILESWNEEGKKIVDNGHGPYESVVGAIVWKGMLVAGVPDGKWVAKRMFLHTEDVLATERFKYGEFQKGTNQVGDYQDSSHILLVADDLLPLTKAEKLWTSGEGCNASAKKNIINAFFVRGPQQFATEIKDRLEAVLNSLAISPFAEPIVLKGTILKDGRILFWAVDGQDARVGSSLITALKTLPVLQPATADGIVVKQDITITIKFNQSVYSFTYDLLPVQVD